MLRELRVRNFAIIDELSLRFASGLNVLTGETGAGKSIIVGALGIALGQRAYAEIIRTGMSEAVVEAFFDITDHPLLSRMGIESPDGIIIRRHLFKGGKSRAYVNDTMVNAQSLQELGRTLVDIHGQNENQSLLSNTSQLRLLDHFGGLDTLRDKVAIMFEEARSLRKLLDDIRLNARERARRADLLGFQVEEIASAGLSEGEDARLEEEVSILSNLSRLNELLELSHGLLYGDEGSCMERLSTAASNLGEMSSIDPSVTEALEVVEQALPLVEEASISLRGLRDKYDMEPGRLDAVQERLELINNLKRKYGDTLAEVLRYRDEAENELTGMQEAEDKAEDLEVRLEEKTAEVHSVAGKLSGERRKAAERIERAVVAEVKALALEKSDFKIDMVEAPLSPEGADAVEFLFTANRGEALKPLQKVASGGELSRIMLAIKGVLREADRIPVLVFDEVDAGIGGATARNVAARLGKLASARQVFCITHLPQIASAGDSHFLIEKKEKKGRVCVIVNEVSGKAREEEIARMLSGKVTETSIEHAREIMAKGQ